MLYETSERKSDEELVAGINSWVDVRDIAKAHVVALEKAEAGGQRILFSAGKGSSRLHFTQGLKFLSANPGPFTWQDFSE
jgi:UDP-glucose 4-epimerase